MIIELFDDDMNPRVTKLMAGYQICPPCCERLELKTELDPVEVGDEKYDADGIDNDSQTESKP